MGLNAARIRATEITGRQSYDARDVILYALGLGVGNGAAATDPAALRYLYEDGLEVIPTLATTLAYPSGWLADPGFGLDVGRVVHAAQSLSLDRSLPPAGSVVSSLRVEAIEDKGAGRGALVHTARELHDEASGQRLAVLRQVMFCRGEGGFGGDKAPPVAARRVPERPPQDAVSVATREEAALLYRLSGDRNPLHIDPSTAAAAGFSRPILHGLATFGFAGYALLRSGRPFRSIEARFSAPVFPGDRLRCALWDEPDGWAFQIVNGDSDQVVLDCGWASAV